MSTTRRTRRWRGIVGVALVAVAGGLLARRPELLLLAILGVGFAMYPRLFPPPAEPQLQLERTLSTTEPAIDEDVTVTVTATNTGDRFISDLRLVDGVPPLLSVVEGTPRVATALSPGAEVTWEYTVEAVPGKHRFEPTTVLTRNLSGSAELSTTLETPTVMNCIRPLTTAPLRETTQPRPGSIVSQEGGRGVEFHRTREYHPGEALERIDWRRFARTGDLSVIEYRPERSAAVVFCVDTDAGRSAEDSRVDPAGGLSRSLAATDRLATSLAETNHAVGLTTYGQRSFWLPPRPGRTQVESLRRALDTAPAFALSAAESREGPSHGRTDAMASIPTAATDGGSDLGGFHERVGPNDQVLFISPLLDDAVVRAVHSIQRAEDRLLVVSPDVTGTGTVGEKLAAHARETRVRSLRAAGIPVLEWQPPASLAETVLEWMERSA